MIETVTYGYFEMAVMLSMDWGLKLIFMDRKCVQECFVDRVRSVKNKAHTLNWHGCMHCSLIDGT